MHIQIVQRNSKQLQSQNKEKNAVSLFHEKKKKNSWCNSQNKSNLQNFKLF